MRAELPDDTPEAAVGSGTAESEGSQFEACRPNVEAVEVELLLQGIFGVYGVDFREYAAPPVHRRVRERMAAEGVTTISALQERVLHDAAAMDRLLVALTHTPTTMFRDPEFYRLFRTEVVPMLRTWPFIRIWHAGCSTGEEVYSMAVLLTEEGLYKRCRLYATDISEQALRRAKRGIYPLSRMREFTSNYLQSGGTGMFSDYYAADHDSVRFRSELRKNVVFACHNLGLDAGFNEFNVILCRNVLLYFNTALRERVHRLFHENLVMFGILGLGNNEFIESSPYWPSYRELDPVARLFRRVV